MQVPEEYRAMFGGITVDTSRPEKYKTRVTVDTKYTAPPPEA